MVILHKSPLMNNNELIENTGILGCPKCRPMYNLSGVYRSVVRGVHVVRMLMTIVVSDRRRKSKQQVTRSKSHVMVKDFF